MTRRLEILVGTAWRSVSRAALQVGSVFRAFEADGTPVEDAQGHRRWRVQGLTPREDGEVDVDAEPIPETEAEAAVRRHGVYWPGSEGQGFPRGKYSS